MTMHTINDYGDDGIDGDGIEHRFHKGIHDYDVAFYPQPLN